MRREIDPACAEAWAGIAALNVQGLHGWAPVEKYLGPAKAALERAFEIDPHLQWAHAVKAHLMWEHEWNQPEADAAIQRALELNPSDSYTWQMLSYMKETRRSFDEAADAALEACRLDPYNRFAWATAFYPLMSAGRYDVALARTRHAGAERTPREPA